MNQPHIIYFAAGCFWGVEATFQKMNGVVATEVGYMGGDRENPSYEQVCTGKTGHAEAVKICFNPEIIDDQALIKAFWECHDPTQLNRQGPDVGSQYRSAIFCTDDAQAALAARAKQTLLDQGRAIVTEIVPPPAPSFFSAEDYHQKYFEKRKIGA